MFSCSEVGDSAKDAISDMKCYNSVKKGQRELLLWLLWFDYRICYMALFTCIKIVFNLQPALYCLGTIKILFFLILFYYALEIITLEHSFGLFNIYS